MELNEKKDKIQNDAVEKWIYSGKQGTIEAITGIGKMFIFLKALMTMPRHQLDTKHLFLAETTTRDKDLQEQITIFNSIYNVDILSLYNLEFHCYQEVYKWRGFNFGLIGCDEVHDQLSPEYIKFHLNNKYDAIICLTALIVSTQTYNLKRDIPLRNYFDKDLVTKHDMIAKIAPICFKYTVNEGQLDNTSRKLNIYVIKNKLDDKNKNVIGGGKHQKFYQTEASAYSYATKLFNDARNLEQNKDEDFIKYEERRELKIIQASNKRSKLLYELLSKVCIVKVLLANIKSKSVIFGNSITSLKKMTPNVVCSQNDENTNDLILDRFNKDIITTIGSFKMLKQGKNLKGVDNCFITSYYSSEVDIIQKIGRLRQDGDKIGSVFIIVTEHTQEVVWFNKMMENIKEYNIIICENIQDCLIQYRSNE